MTDDVFDSPDSLDGESLDGADPDATSDEIAFPSPDEILTRQRMQYAKRFARRPDAPPIQRRPRGEAFMPTPDWLRAFREQCTRETRNAVKRYAYTMSAWLENSGLPAGDAWVEEQVHKAIADTLDGRIRWRFDRPVTLYHHLRDTIRTRAWKIVERGRRFREVSLDQPQLDEHIEAEIDEKPTELEASLETRRGRRERDQLATSDMISKILAAVRAQTDADNDDVGRAMLGAYEQGITDKAEVCAFAKISEDEYHNGHRRILRRAKRLTAELQTIGKEALSREPE